MLAVIASYRHAAVQPAPLMHSNHNLRQQQETDEHTATATNMSNGSSGMWYQSINHKTC